MYILLDSNDTVWEIIPDVSTDFPGVPLEERYAKEFCEKLIHVENSTAVQQNWFYNRATGTFHESSVKKAKEHTYTELEQTQQAITDLELATIGQGQSMTDLELMILEGNYV